MTSKKHLKQMAAGTDLGCYFCSESDYRLLDCHRIVPGAEGGTYHPWNTLTLCVACHRKVHVGIIKVLGRYKCAGGKRLSVVKYEEDGVVKWK